MEPVVIDPKTTMRAEAFELWMDAPNPMVTFFKTLDVTRLVKMSGKHHLKFNNPFLIWGRYRRGFMKTTLTISFQFHHTQMDGAHAGRFLALVQENINRIEHAVYRPGK